MKSDEEWEKHEWTDEELLAAYAILTIEDKLEPKCESCGYGALGQKCPHDLGGYCRRHDQENFIAFHNTIDAIARRVGFHTVDGLGWRQHYPIDRVWSISDGDKALMMDLLELPDRTFKSRNIDDRWDALKRKAVVYMTYADRYQIKFTKRGLALAERVMADSA
jgi:hypothetical protein